ncbi:matrixin family metalloprotease (plasmid) [Streptomyces sp. BI20]|uniref:matrixin family metalloprotease n=1 Tax=Streptomyces sp. BI20 TaxID=3403460 RepID=UPI003C7282C0
MTRFSGRPGGVVAACAAATLLALPHPAWPAPRTHVLAVATCTPSGSDSRGHSSVDGRVIAWEDDETVFKDAVAYANRQWSTNGLTRVKIHRDTSTEIADLQWRDVDRSDGDWARRDAQWKPHTGADNVYLNRHRLDKGGRSGTDHHRRHVAAHELGHALGLCHKPFPEASLLWPNHRDIDAENINAPTAKDRADYHSLWG